VVVSALGSIRRWFLDSPFDGTHPSGPRRIPTRDVGKTNSPVCVRPETFVLARALASARLVLLVGPQGSGRHSLVASLLVAIRDGDRRVPDVVLCRRRVFATSVSEITSTSGVVGEMEAAVLALFRSLEHEDAILVLEDAHLATTAGGTSTDPHGTVLAALLAAMRICDVVVVGVTTPGGLATISRHTTAVLDYAAVVELSSAPVPLATELLATSWSEIPLEVVCDAVALSSRLSPGRAQPGAGASLLGRAGDASRRGLLRAAREEYGLVSWLVDSDLALDASDLAFHLGEQLFGQPEALGAATRTILSWRTGLARPGRPVAVLLALGPSGVGKTEFAKVLARVCCRDETRLVRIDASAVRDPDTVLAGSSSRLGLAGALRARPSSVVLIDEVQVAPARLLEALLPATGEALVVTDDGTVDASGSVIVLSASTDEVLVEGTEVLRDRAEEVALSLLGRALFGRLDEVVVFTPLDEEVLARLTRREIDRLAARVASRQPDLTVDVEPGLLARIVSDQARSGVGARGIERTVARLVGSAVAAHCSAMPASIGHLVVDATGGARLYKRRPVGP
jgi:ATP-dependent Clp protease ATP-binding subunit ClpA